MSGFVFLRKGLVRQTAERTKNDLLPGWKQVVLAYCRAFRIWFAMYRCPRTVGWASLEVCVKVTGT